MIGDHINVIEAVVEVGYEDIVAAPPDAAVAWTRPGSGWAEDDISKPAKHPSRKLTTSTTQRSKLAALPATLCLRTASRRDVVQSFGDHRAPLHCLWRSCGR